MKPLDTALHKITVMHPPTLSLPDRLSRLLNRLLTYHGTTGRTKPPQTFTKLNEVDILVTYLRQGIYNIPSKISR